MTRVSGHQGASTKRNVLVKEKKDVDFVPHGSQNTAKEKCKLEM